LTLFTLCWALEPTSLVDHQPCSPQEHSRHAPDHSRLHFEPHPRLPHQGSSLKPLLTSSHFTFIMRGIATAAAAATSMLVGRAVADVDPIVIKGSKFFYGGNGTQL
jgi:hypothetical protein